MALKVQTVGPGPRDVVFRVADVTFSSSYPAGGEPFNVADFELTKILFVAAEFSHTSKLQAWFDPTTSTLRLGVTGTSGGASTEVATSSNNAATTVRVLVAGTK